MKLFHLSDLHIGKRLNDFNLIEDQKYMLNQFLEMMDLHKPAGVILAGDIYDKSVPSVSAVEVFDEFLTSINQRKVPVFIISGNHDSPERLGFGSRILESKGVYLAGMFKGDIVKESLVDGDLKINIFLMPFLNPATVRRFFPEKNTESYEAAVRTVISNIGVDQREINLLVAHQFVTVRGVVTKRYESETITVGGQDNMDCSLFDAFDYVALGHLHGAQSIGRETIRYCGSPLKYSFSEKDNLKEFTVINIKSKGNIELEFLPVKPLHEMRQIKGPLDVLVSDEVSGIEPKDDYIKVILTDKDQVLDAMSKLRTVYPNIMSLQFDNSGIKEAEAAATIENVEKKTGMELFCEFYESQQNRELGIEKQELVQELLEELGGRS